MLQFYKERILCDAEVSDPLNWIIIPTEFEIFSAMVRRVTAVFGTDAVNNSDSVVSDDRKVVTVPLFDVPPGRLPIGIEESDKELQCSLSSGRDFNPGPC
jgi:hypothetical protein